MQPAIAQRKAAGQIVAAGQPQGGQLALTQTQRLGRWQRQLVQRIGCQRPAHHTARFIGGKQILRWHLLRQRLAKAPAHGMRLGVQGQQHSGSLTKAVKVIRLGQLDHQKITGYSAG